MTHKARFYVVWKGRNPGIYATWVDTEAQVKGFAGAKFKGFDSLKAAQLAFEGAAQPKAEQGALWHLTSPGGEMPEQPIPDSLSVDAACSGNPGWLEYRCLDNRTGRVVFKEGPFQDGTNNVGEFLAIVQALAWCKEKGLKLPVYSDSRVAISWVRQKRCKTNLKPTEHNQKLFALIRWAERWLAENPYDNPVLEWNSRLWGQISADYGRK
ncbi:MULTISPECIES: viroplasmin family protein [unclassified Meiothermus]|uniref:ribonuclease H1 domain-containing protein n=1 Tax=unclassified Meiothermus TaxID=370471 RepID=UPI000D7BE1C9|nr:MULTISPECIES: ribonuclease H family protein [unclassified Meiothermus]PZA06603.1 ribonuclease H [Meiothermus sp. Pnk-1]RYM37706.1 ribonuclease H [Meiothermus sp. PNK-Is4]